MNTPNPEVNDPVAPPARPSRPKLGWIVGAAAAVLILLIGAIGVTAAVVGGDDDDDDRFERDEISAIVPEARNDSDELTDSDSDDVLGSSDVTDPEDAALLAAARISPERASDLAVDAADGGTVTDLDIDDEAGTVVYEIEVRDATVNPVVEKDVVLNADSGAIISVVNDRS